MKTSPYAPNLRKTQTDPEKLLWSKLRNRQLVKVKFRRQHPIPPYVIDFACPTHKLAIEIDGGGHNNARVKTYDKLRTIF